MLHIRLEFVMLFFVITEKNAFQWNIKSHISRVFKLVYFQKTIVADFQSLSGTQIPNFNFFFQGKATKF